MPKQYKKKKFAIICFAVIAVIALLVCFFLTIPYYKAYNVDKLTEDILMENYDINSKKNLMIVAHPDDDTLWGGAELLSGDWVVVVITNGNNKQRSTEFHNVMDYCNCIGIMLCYPDKVNGKRDDWKHVNSQIQEDLSLIINYKKWDKIVTHNPDGEYGHQHHIMTSEMVTQVCKSENAYDVLYYFGKYYKKSDVDSVSGLTQIDDDKKSDLDKMLSLYTSQQATVEKLRHMVYYEMWVKADEWT